MTLPSECLHESIAPVADTAGFYRCMRCLAIADPYLARGRVKAFDVSITIGGVKAPEPQRESCRHCGTGYPVALAAKEGRLGYCTARCYAKGPTPIPWELDHVPIAQGDVYPADYKKCARCGLALHRHEGRWAVLVAMQGYDAVCRATPEQKAHPLMLKDVVENPKLLAPKPCQACSGSSADYQRAREYALAWLEMPLSDDPIASELVASVQRRLLTPRDPFPLPPPEYGVDMSPFIKTPGFGEAVRHAIEMIKPATLSLDEMMLSAGYVPKDKAVSLADFEAMKVKAYERGDELQTVKDENRAIKAENSDLRRKVERLERRK
jgi:hypothetical protein